MKRTVLPSALPSAPDGRAAALHRRAMARGGEAAELSEVHDAENLGGVAAPDRPSLRQVPSLPGTGALAVAAIGLALGLAATAAVVDRGWDPGAVAVGPWVTRPRAGTPAIDPYARADFARTGVVPLAASEGVSFTATTDDTGYRLLRSCSYRLSGDVPPTRFWTLTVTDRVGSAAGGAAVRSAFTSAEVVRDAQGRFTIALAPRARPGNWLPLSGDGPFALTLRLYDTPLAGDAAEIGAAPLPGIARQGCEGERVDAHEDGREAAR